MQAFRPLQRYFEFSGRSGRTEFWQFYLLTIAANWFASIVDGTRGGPYGPALPIATFLVATATFLPSCAVAVRRLHDRGRSGFLYWLTIGTTLIWAPVIAVGLVVSEDTGRNGVAITGFVLLALWFALLIYLTRELASKGDDGHNGYGPPDLPPADSLGTFDMIRTLAQPRPTTPVAPNMNEALASIEQLGKLKERGLITEEEFAVQKARLLDPGA